MDSFEVDRPSDQRLGLYFHTSHELPRNPDRLFKDSPSVSKPPKLSPIANMQSDLSALSKADSIIDELLKSKRLPHYPNALVPASGTPLLTTSRAAWEHESLPFTSYELGRGAQYSTLLSSPSNRGVTFAEGGWEELDLSPASMNNSRSRTGTPDPNKPRTKISLKDYKSAPKKSAEEIEKVREQQLVRRKEEAEKQKQKREGELKELAQAEADKRAAKNEAKKAVRREEVADEQDRQRRKRTPVIYQEEVDEGQHEKQKQQDEKERKLALKALMQQHKAEQAKKAKENAKRPLSKPSPEPTRSSKPAKGLPPMLSPLHLEVEDQEIRLPRLLSPDLPSEVEEALLRLSSVIEPVEGKHGDHGSRDGKTFEARNERRNLPDAPGVARKTTKPKAKHHERLSPERPSRIVKLRYGKRNVRNVERLLNMKPKPGQTFEDATRHARIEEKKRARDSADDYEERPTKRAKPPAHLEVNDEPRTPYSKAQKSPGLPQPSNHRSLLGTPKKGEAMARVSSADSHGHARTPSGHNTTPKPAPTSTPISISRPRSTSILSKGAAETLESLKAEFSRYQELATSLKRKMDHILQTKNPKPPVLTLEQEKLGTVIGIESAAVFMLGFAALDKTRRLERKSPGGETWEGVLALMPFITRIAKPSPELSTAANLVVAVSRECLSSLHHERLAVETGKDFDLKFRDAMVKNSRERVLAWNSYFTESAAAGVQQIWFKGDVKEVVGSLLTALGDYVKKEGLKWEAAEKI